MSEIEKDLYNENIKISIPLSQLVDKIEEPLKYFYDKYKPSNDLLSLITKVLSNSYFGDDDYIFTTHYDKYYRFSDVDELFAFSYYIWNTHYIK